MMLELHPRSVTNWYDTGTGIQLTASRSIVWTEGRKTIHGRLRETPRKKSVEAWTLPKSLVKPDLRLRLVHNTHVRIKLMSCRRIFSIEQRRTIRGQLRETPRRKSVKA